MECTWILKGAFVLFVFSWFTSTLIDGHISSSASTVFVISNSNQKLSTMSCGNTKRASILLVRKLYTLMQNLGPLPENVCLNMKLSYYDDGKTNTRHVAFFLFHRSLKLFVLFLCSHLLLSFNCFNIFLSIVFAGV